VLASQSFDLKSVGKWEEYTALLTASDTDGKAKLAIEFNKTGTVSLDYVSLFPEKTFNNRPNGLRQDVAKFLQDLQPAFVRWPGGCVVEGITLDNRYEWKKSLGDPARRSGIYDTWGYRCSYGFGYHEFLQFCEDIGAGGMFVCNVGIGCQYRMGDACDDKDIAYYVDDVLDAIEYALGDVNTEWGAKRADAGHPKPFPLKYVEIGNENWGKVYNERFDIFYKAIKEKYPQLTLISNHGLGDGVKGINKTDMIDPHWYVAPDFFFTNTHIFDKQPRGDYNVYVGEYACNQGVGGGNMLAALSEAAFISGMERNGDLVTMCSYAPLLENRNDRGWPVNLIWLSTDSVVGRSSYYVQKMYAENKPTYNFPVDLNLKPVRENFGEGAFGVGTWATQAEFKDIRITTANNQQLSAGQDNWDAVKGEWTNVNGTLSQQSDEMMTMNTWKAFKDEKYSVSLKARKIAGKEGFFLYFGMTDDQKAGYLLNIGGWGNTRTALEKLENGKTVWTEKGFAHNIETDRWYDIRLVVNSFDMELFMDGVSVYRYENKKIQHTFAVAGYDEPNGELILKVVNADETPFVASINLNGAKDISRDGKVITLSGNPTDENSFADPLKISPKEEDYHRFGTSFKYTFKPSSFTILRVKAGKNNK
jgi:alpha-L-arabinofuranosidase